MFHPPTRRRPSAPGRRRRPFGPARRGVSLLELVAVVTLMGVFAAVAASRSDGLFADAAARSSVEHVAGLLHDAKRRAILTGDSHGLDFNESGGSIASAQLVRETSPAVWDPVGDPYVPPEGVTMESAQPNARFTFEGVPASGGVTVSFEGPHQTWQIWMPPHTGAIRITEI